MKNPNRKTPDPLEPEPILKALALSLRINQMLLTPLRRALHHSDAVEALIILPFIQRARELHNDMSSFHDAIKEKSVKP